MANIQTLFLCPRCDEGITSIGTTTSCPSCGLPLGKQEALPYTPPFTFTEQHEKYQDTNTYVEVLRDLPIHKANSIMNDALTLIELISGKNTSTTDIRNLVGMAIKIGEIAKSYDAFLTSGGKHTPSFFLKQTTPPSGDPNVPSEKARSNE